MTVRAIASVEHLPMTDYELILAGEPGAATAAAKRLISSGAADASKLREIAVDKRHASSARIVAIYVLGFTDDGTIARPTLAAIAADHEDVDDCRAHAAQALMRLHALGIAPLMEEILGREEAPQVRRWCVHALGEMDGTHARNVLLRFADTNPSGEVLQELRTALSRQWFRTRELGGVLRDVLRQARSR
jgi:HEAT repeat protein